MCSRWGAGVGMLTSLEQKGTWTMIHPPGDAVLLLLTCPARCVEDDGYPREVSLRVVLEGGAAPPKAGVRFDVEGTPDARTPPRQSTNEGGGNVCSKTL